MTIEEHNKITSGILQACENNVDVQSLLIQLQDDYKQTLATQSETEQTIKTLTEERDKYAKLNNDLWLRQNTHSQIETREQQEETPPKKRNFEDLKFD